MASPRNRLLTFLGAGLLASGTIPPARSDDPKSEAKAVLDKVRNTYRKLAGYHFERVLLVEESRDAGKLKRLGELTIITATAEAKPARIRQVQPAAEPRPLSAGVQGPARRTTAHLRRAELLLIHVRKEGVHEGKGVWRREHVRRRINGSGPTHVPVCRPRRRSCSRSQGGTRGGSRCRQGTAEVPSDRRDDQAAHGRRARISRRPMTHWGWIISSRYSLCKALSGTARRFTPSSRWTERQQVMPSLHDLFSGSTRRPLQSCAASDPPSCSRSRLRDLLKGKRWRWS